MLRAVPIGRQASRPFICWQCLSKSNTGTRNYATQSGTSRTSPGQSKKGARALEREFHAGVSRRSPALQTIDTTPDSDDLFLTPLPETFDIRERLQKWEKDNASSFAPYQQRVERVRAGEVVNNTAGATNNSFQIAQDEAEDDTELGQDFESGLVDVGSRRNFLLPGDLVELGSHNPELAVFVRDFDFQSQFYTISGRWVHKTSTSITFSVPEFFSEDELDSIKPFLPQEEVPLAMSDVLQGFDISVPREAGKDLVVKMMKFLKQADDVYRIAAKRLDNALEIISSPKRYRYNTLEEIAFKVLGHTVWKPKNQGHPMHVLYAVHRSLVKSDIGFQPQKIQAVRGASEYEVNSKLESLIVERVRQQVRLLRNSNITGVKRPANFEQFIARARRLIDESRKIRPFTTHGTLGPALTSTPRGVPFRRGKLATEKFTKDELDFVIFLQSWACVESFGTNSSLNGIGSAILGAIDRYEGAALSKSTAFTCLQELGIVPPWEHIASFKLRLPYTSQFIEPPSEHRNDIGEDKLASIRRDWGDLRAYCIDDINAQEIDDGVSVEPTSTPDEYWVHVHVADPAAYLQVTDLSVKHAESATATVYLPDRTVPMLPPSLARDKFSLADGRPTLTFSAKLNIGGEILEHKITPGIIRNVVNITPATLYEIETGSSPVQDTVYTVGSTAELATDCNRPMLQADEISSDQKQDLEIIAKLAQARSKVRHSRGAITSTRAKASIDVSFDGESWIRRTNFDSRHHHRDPTIRLQIPSPSSASSESDTVMNLMILAGEVAAQWCHARGIPILYRVTPRRADKQDPLQYYFQNIQSSRDENGEISPEKIQEYFGLAGKIQPSTTAGPHILMGTPMFTRCTSPLRRFSDMLVHFQIEAALLEEARLGKSLVGNTREDFVPFSKKRIEKLLPRLAYRERLFREGEGSAIRSYAIQFMLRSWKYGEFELPSPMTFVTRSINVTDRTVGGVLKDFLVGGVAQLSEHINIDDVKVGDEFEVEIADLNSYTRQIMLKALGPVIVDKSLGRSSTSELKWR